MMNEIDKGLRGLGGVKMRIEYADLVVACKEKIDEICSYHVDGGNVNMNTDLFLEGLKEDIEDVRNGEECGIVPKTLDDVDEA